MMGRHEDRQRRLFYKFDLEEMVPADHLLRGIDNFLDLQDLRDHLAPFYSRTGRPSIDPEPLILGYAYRIRSEPRLGEGEARHAIGSSDVAERAQFGVPLVLSAEHRGCRSDDSADGRSLRTALGRFGAARYAAGNSPASPALWDEVTHELRAMRSRHLDRVVARRRAAVLPPLNPGSVP